MWHRRSKEKKPTTIHTVSMKENIFAIYNTKSNMKPNYVTISVIVLIEIFLEPNDNCKHID